MNVEVLNILLSDRPIGKLFRFANGTTSPIIRFVADDKFSKDPHQAVVSVSMRAANPEQQASLWADITAPIFNGEEGRLPVFFQSLLPEGVFRTHLAQQRNCAEDDHFGLFAACGGDLPGALKAMPVQVEREELARLVTQENDALEMSVMADPLPQGVSISGMQPKVGLIEKGGHYVARTRLGVTRIIGKLPQTDRLMLPEVEHLSLQLAQAAGANVCEHKLVPLEKLRFEHGYTIGGSSNFLAVTRFDREEGKRIHCEVFGQALAIDPRQKYTGATYAAMAGLMMRYPESLGQPAVHELMRLITINELLGNYDAHLQNFALLYRDGVTPELSPAYDIVAWSVYIKGQGNALALYRNEDGTPASRTLGPASVRAMCNAVQIPEKPVQRVIKDTVRLAFERWPDMIAASSLMDNQKQVLMKHFYAHPFVQQLAAKA